MQQKDNIIRYLRTAPIEKAWREKIIVFVEKEFDTITTLPAIIAHPNPVIFDPLKLCRKVEYIKKYDVIYTQHLNITNHYALVYKVTIDAVYALVITSKEKVFCFHLIENDRYFKPGYISESLIKIPIEQAKENFVRVWENRKEADVIFAKYKAGVKALLNL